MGLVTDARKLGRSRKSGVGLSSHNMSCGQFLGRRGGEVDLHMPARPEGGVARLIHVGALLDGKLGTGAILCTARARAYSACEVGMPSLNLYRFRVYHPVADGEGLSRGPYMEAGDGKESKNSSD